MSYLPTTPRPSDTPIWDTLVAEHGHDPTEPVVDTPAPVVTLPARLEVAS